MSAEKEIRDEKFRQWKRDLMAREPEDAPAHSPLRSRSDKEIKEAVAKAAEVRQYPNFMLNWWVEAEAKAAEAANDIRWLGEVPKVRPRIVCASCGLIMTHMGVHERLVHYNEEIKRLLDKLGNKQ